MSDIKFGTDGWRAIIGKEFTVANLIRLSKALAKLIKTIAHYHLVYQILLAFNNLL